ncbi:21815_t:CDS:2, partial [Gigaspora margarita]
MLTEIENCVEYPSDRKVFSPALKNDKTPKKLPDKFRLLGLVIFSIIYLLLFEINAQDGQNISQNKTHTFQGIVDLAGSGSKNLSLEIPETDEMCDYRANIRNLGVIMEKSDIIVKNGKKISQVLFGLDKEIQKAGDALEEFRHQAKNFYFSLASEMKAIMEEIEKPQHGTFNIIFKYLIKSNNHMSNREAEFIHERLEVLEKQIPVFIEKLYQLLSAIDSVHNSADNTQGYLIDGEREALRALKQHWLGNIADSEVQKRAEDELIRVRILIKILRKMAPNLIKFETFLKEYRRNILDVAKEVINPPTKPTAENMKYFKKAIADLEEQHAQFSSAKKTFISMDARYLEENQTLEEQHTKFSSEEYKPVDDMTNDQNYNYSTFYEYLKWVYVFLNDAQTVYIIFKLVFTDVSLKGLYVYLED